MNKTLFTIIFGLFTLVGFSQTGTVKGKIVDKETRETIPFANIILEQNGVFKYGTTSDFDGLFKIDKVVPGQYLLRIKFIGYDEIQENINVKADETSIHDFEMGSVQICGCEIITYAFPSIAQDRNREVGAPF